MKVGYVKKESKYKGTIEDKETLDHLLTDVEEKDWQLYCVDDKWFQVYDKDGFFTQTIIVRLLDDKNNLGVVDMGSEELSIFVDKLNKPKVTKVAKENLMIHVHTPGCRFNITTIFLAIALASLTMTILTKGGFISWIKEIITVS